MQIGSYQFKPRPVPSLVLLLLLPFLIYLGLWQLDRYDIKRGMVQEQASNHDKPVVEIGTIMQIESLGRGREVSLTGEFDLQHSILLVNRKHAGRPGYDVFTPFRIDGGGSILVNRGWMADLTGRGAVPELPGVAGKLQIQGLLDTPPSIGIKLGTPQAGDLGWPRKVQYMEMEWLARELQTDLPEYTLLQVSPDEQAYTRNWEEHFQNPGGIPAERHMSYAIQWFALALALLVIFVVVNIKKLNGK